MPPESAKLLADIADGVDQIIAYTRGKTDQDYLADRQLRESVQWNFAVIGEAVAQLCKVDPATAEQISEYQRIIAFRNQLIHGYGVIKNEINWDIITTKLPILRADLTRLLRT